MDSEAERTREGWQRVELNIEETWMRALILKASVGGLRKAVAEDAWGRYFIVNKGLDAGRRWQAETEFPGGVREALGISNGKVGYVFLVDGECRIRWAGSGDALPGEAEALASGVRKLVEEMRGGNERG
jgi:ATPase complex subunit ATP10